MNWMRLLLSLLGFLLPFVNTGVSDASGLNVRDSSGL